MDTDQITSLKKKFRRDDRLDESSAESSGETKPGSGDEIEAAHWALKIQSGECGREDLQALEDWISADPKRKSLLESYKQLTDAADDAAAYENEKMLTAALKKEAARRFFFRLSAIFLVTFLFFSLLFQILR